MAGVDEISARTAAEELAGSVVDIVDGALRSVILHGSLAAGGFRPGRSDIDLLVVVDGGLSDPQLDALTDRVRHARIDGASGIDLHVVTAAVAGAPAPAPPLELHVGRYDGSSVGFEVDRRVPAAPDLPAELSMARADGQALRGAQPGEVLAPVPDEWLHERGRYWLTTWQSRTDDAEDAALMVLTACRIWRFAVEGRHCAKAQAAGWALDRDPSLTAVRQALHQYEVNPAAPIDADGVAQVLDTVLRETTPGTVNTRPVRS
ncbi:aminoglycoside adenylyltransferase domain-containing protein [Micromonospora sp. NPDC007230]|uniref:aminoglycoside adenylyltransferase domain-containing protein n=1 Tax=Micromonospora sp. NPDC007230 TaxID=3364237 RepID=UPI003673F95F